MALDEQLLDDADGLAGADPSGSLRALAGAGAQVRMALTSSADAGVGRIVADGRPRAVVVASLGGSAVVGDVLTLLAGSSAPVPVSVRRGLPLPGWVGPLDLVVAVSMSGRAPGPLGLAAEAARRGCRLLTVGAARSPLAEVAERTGGVHVPVAHSHSTTAAGRASRMALWSLVVPVVVAAYELGISDASPQVLERVASRLDAAADHYRPSSDAFVNPAKALALDLAGHVPVVLGDGDVTGVAASRAVSMLARTARVPAVRGALPDDAGDIVATFDGPLASQPDDIFSDPEFGDGPAGPRMRLVLMRDAPPTPDRPDGSWLETARTADAVKLTAEDAGIRVTEFAADPGHPLERLADLVARTDFAAVYLALAGGIDPLTSPHVADLRDRTH